MQRYRWSPSPILKIETIEITFGGKSYAGKAKLIEAFLGEEFTLDSISTLAVEKSEEKIKLKNGEEIKLILLDTPGQERYRSLASSYSKYCNGAIIAFDLTNRKSFDRVLDWLNVLKAIANYPIALFGCKCDLIEDREISKEEIEQFSKEYNIPYLKLIHYEITI